MERMKIEIFVLTDIDPAELLDIANEIVDEAIVITTQASDVIIPLPDETAVVVVSEKGEKQ
tara:strand:+ start:2460 stop:2642 length:183 start_codon:yes stop_codon:yes gene_type:complete